MALNRVLKVFTGNANPDLAKAICDHMDIPVGKALIGSFADGETRVQVLEDVRGADAFVVQPTCPSVNDNLMELLIIADALSRASAERITAVLPYYGYARQDRKHEGRVPITAKLVANLISAAGVMRVLTMDLHATQIQGFFDCPVDHLYARPVMLEYLLRKRLDDMVVVSPDIGSMKMADAYRKRLGGRLAVIEKRRTNSHGVERGHVIGDVQDQNVLVLDDMISTGGSICQAIQTCKDHGARSIIACATHAVFCGPIYEELMKVNPEEVMVSDTVPLGSPAPDGLNLTVHSVAPLLGEAILRIHENRSVSKMFQD